MHRLSSHARKGFTLVELLVVVAVIALLVSIVLVNLRGAREGAAISNALVFQSQVHRILGVDIVGWWNFDAIESGNIVIDGLGLGNNGTVNGAVLVEGLRQLGNALSFDGLDDFVNMGNRPEWNLANTNFTLAAWFLVPALPIENSAMLINRFVGGTPGAGYAIHMSFTTGILSFGHRADGGDHLAIHSSLNYADNRWYHLVVTVDISTRTGILYINGIRVGSDTYTGNLINHNETLHIGGRGVAMNWFGRVDEVRIYNRALTAQEVESLYAQTKGKYLANEQERLYPH